MELRPDGLYFTADEQAVLGLRDTNPYPVSSAPEFYRYVMQLQAELGEFKRFKKLMILGRLASELNGLMPEDIEPIPSMTPIEYDSCHAQACAGLSNDELVKRTAVRRHTQTF